MTETVATVSLGTSPDQELGITDVAHLTGYNSQYLRRLEKSGAIPASHKKNNMRAWFAHEVEKIIAHKTKMAEKTAKRMQTLYKKGNAARRKD
jgi:predicted DNA-binding transcriptional regulator AlpA